MSTHYYALRQPWTDVRLVQNPTHDHLKLWTDHGYAGVLTLLAGTGHHAALCFAHCDAPLLQTSYRGPEYGIVVIEFAPDLPDELRVMSESGQTMTVGEIRATAKRSHASNG